jgi:UDP-N-acetylmuramoyl-tripeptide--D-alanyl-D-alanine ligase
MLHKANNNYITIGINNDSDFMAKDIEYGDVTKFKYNDEEVIVRVGGEAFVYNALMAIAVGTLLKIDINDIKKGIENFKLTNNRLETIDHNGYTIINDCYNANYDSMKEGIKNLSNREGRKIAVLGDMLELGNYSEDLHRKVGIEVKNNNIDILVTVGKEAKYIDEEFDGEKYHFDNNKDAIICLKNIINKGDTILVKASNGMNFIEIVKSLS